MMIPSSCSFANPPRQNKLTHFRKLQAANHPIVFNGGIGENFGRVYGVFSVFQFEQTGFLTSFL